MLKSAYRFFKSVKLAFVLIAYITVTSIVSTFIPQGKELAFYQQQYAPFIAWLITATKFTDFFRSILFLFPAFLFFVNLSVCSVARLVREFKPGVRKRRFGPDLIHLGLLLLIVGAVVTFTGRTEGSVYLGEGDHIGVPGDYTLRLESFETLTYDDGRPKDWISTVSVEKDGETIVSGFPIEVNKPLKIGKITIYQMSFSEEATLIVKDSEGAKYSVPINQLIQTTDGAFLFRSIESLGGSTNAVFEKWEDHKITGTKRVPLGGRIGEYVVEEMSRRDLTGLQAVTDPGYTPVLVALILIALGLCLTYAQKIGDKKI